MLKKNNKTKLLEVFFDDPLPLGIGFQLRELSRKISLAPKSVKLYLDELESEGLVVKKSHRIHSYPIYYANRDNDYFKLLKKMNLIRRIFETGLLLHLSNKCMPKVIILYGSSSRGEDLKSSDIDIFIQAKKKDLDLHQYEIQLNRKISLFFESNFNNLSDELKLNLINGIMLHGYLTVELQNARRINSNNA